MQEKGLDVPALEREPNLPPDLAALFRNYATLSRTRQSAFEGLGALRLTDIATLYDLERWEEGGIALKEYIEMMLSLDGAARQFYSERNPPSKPPPKKS